MAFKLKHHIISSWKLLESLRTITPVSRHGHRQFPHVVGLVSVGKAVNIFWSPKASKIIYHQMPKAGSFGHRHRLLHEAHSLRPETLSQLFEEAVDERVVEGSVLKFRNKLEKFGMDMTTAAFAQYINRVRSTGVQRRDPNVAGLLPFGDIRDSEAFGGRSGKVGGELALD